MKKLVLFFLFVVVFAHSYSQIKWNPQWANGSIQMLEYIYSKAEMKADTLSEFDSVHATIQAKYIGLIGDDHFFQWKFTDYHADTTRGSNASNKLVYEIIAKTVSRCPVKFTISRNDFDLKILNEKELDSVSGLISAEIAGRMPNKKDKEDQDLATGMLQMLFGLKIDKAVYEVIRQYYGIYQKADLKLNEKRDVKSEMAKQGNGAFAGGAEGYAMLDDKEPNTYRYKYESVMDLGKMLGQLGKALSKDDSTSNKIDAEMSKTKMGVVMNGETKISRADMAVISYYQYENTNGNLFAMDMKEREMTLIRAIK